MSETMLRIAGNSLAFYGSVTEKLQYKELVPLSIAVVVSLENEDTARFEFYSEEFIQLLVKNWFVIDLKGLEYLTAFAVLLLQGTNSKFFQFGLRVFSALYQGKDHFEESQEYFRRVLPFFRTLWKPTKNESIDELIVRSLFHGLARKTDFDTTLFVLEAIYSAFGSSLPLNNQICLTVLLTHYVICIANPSNAIRSFNSLKDSGL